MEERERDFVSTTTSSSFWFETSLVLLIRVCVCIYVSTRSRPTIRQSGKSDNLDPSRLIQSSRGERSIFIFILPHLFLIEKKVGLFYSISPALDFSKSEPGYSTSLLASDTVPFQIEIEIKLC